MLLLQQVTGLMGKELASDTVLNEMLHLLSELLGLNRGRIVLFDEAAGQACIRYAYGLTRDEIKRGVYALEEGITGRVLARGQLIIVQDIDKEPSFLGRVVERSKLPPGPVSYIALPIMIGQKVIGVLATHRIRMRARPLTDDLSILRILATMAGQILHLRTYVKEKTEALEMRNQQLARALEIRTNRYGIVGTSPELLRAVSELERVSNSTASVLLLGESGTGKELFARALHLASPRQDKPFIKINCAAIPDTLFESELFGYERGAFTGANSARAGWFEQADGGTIFLDEIGELPLSMQSKLLRTLQEGTITRLGGKREVKVNVRLVAATNRDLAIEVSQGVFRQDLYYRLNVIPILLPTLAGRRGDIPALALQFLNRINQANQRNVSFDATAIERLQLHDWPGNIRELSNLIERMVLLADRAVLSAADVERFLPTLEQVSSSPGDASGPPNAPHQHDLIRPYVSASSHSPDELRKAVERCGGNKSRAAQVLGMTARQFNYRWKRAGF
ncbi:transcriptional regulator, NifA subfamily, Fis family [Pseudomonas abietaniphila]|uniref:Transcriptional regulator, NifA subfamily, Fis family n=2 Tax=Pseudomonas abietaniphila TaxID=89065 RepID=A0A1G7VXC0_9PSED|nr:transcriptional regulator, NifA subfamily, Fis family [Pseudomonas abietaniphila]